MPRLNPEVCTVLQEHTAIDPVKHVIRLTVRFDDDPASPFRNRMDLYRQVTTVITGIGGRYKDSGKGTGRYAFPDDPTDLLNAILDSGEINPLALFETPDAIADLLVERHPDMPLWCTGLELGGQRLDVPDDADELRACLSALPVVLEPSAGRGALIRALLRAGYVGRIVAVELDPTNLRLLRKQHGEHPLITIVAGDILTADLGAYGPFDGAIMNPPFDAPGAKNPLLYIDHIRRVASLLRPRHHLTAITPANWRFRKGARERAFHEWVQETGEGESLGKGAVAESGTGVETWLVRVRADLPQDAPGPWPIWSDPADQFPSYRCGNLDMAMQGGDAGRWAQVHAIWRQIRDGVLPLDPFGAALPPTRTAILRFYQQIADALMHEEGLYISLRPDEETWMVDWFLEQYQAALAQGRIEAQVTLNRSAAHA